MVSSADAAPGPSGSGHATRTSSGGVHAARSSSGSQELLRGSSRDLTRAGDEGHIAPISSWVNTGLSSPSPFEVRFPGLLSCAGGRVLYACAADRETGCASVGVLCDCKVLKACSFAGLNCTCSHAWIVLLWHLSWPHTAESGSLPFSLHFRKTERRWSRAPNIAH